MNQLVVLAGGLVCWGLGGLLVGNAIYWRLHAVRVQGEVIGVRRSGNCLNSVYRYTSTDGASVEATSLEGSSSVDGRETGRLVPLWVIPAKPNEVQEAGNHVFTFVGAVLLAAGVALFWVGLTAWRTGPMTWVMAGVFLLHLLMRLRKVIAPRDKSLPPSAWRALLKSAANAAPAQPVEELTAQPEFHERQVRQRAQLARLAPFLVLAGLAVLALGVHESRMLLKLEASGMRTVGTVTGLSPSRDSSAGDTYHALVCYQDAAGRTVVFRDSTGSNPSLYHVGETVTVLYPPDEPARAVIDRGVWNWLPSAMLYTFGAICFAAGLAAWRRRAGEVPVQTAGLGPAA